MHLRDTLDQKAKERDWRIERVLWGVIAAIVLAGAVGLLGTGPLAEETTVREVGGATYRLTYDDINRRDHVSVLRLEVLAPQALGDELRVSFSDPLASALTIRSSVPAADGGELGPDGATFVFVVGGWNEPVVVTFEYLPEHLWSTKATILVQAGDAGPVPMPFHHFIHP